MKSGGHCFALTSNEPKAEISEAVEQDVKISTVSKKGGNPGEETE